jgi:hypothetical protein
MLTHLRPFQLPLPPASGPANGSHLPPFKESSKVFHRTLIKVHGFPRNPAEADAMNHSQQARVADRDRGQRRVTHVTGGIATGGGLAAAVIAIALAQGPVSASTTTGSSPVQSPGSGSPSTPQSPAPQYGQSGGVQALQPPTAAPSHSRGGGSHSRSGAS